MKLSGLQSASDSKPEISRLIEVLRATDDRLEELLGGEVDTVTDRNGDTYVLRRAQGHLRRSETYQQNAMLSALPAHISMLDARGVIVLVNASWKQFGGDNGLALPNHGVGANYLDICDRAAAGGSLDAQQAAAGIRSVLRGEMKSFLLEYTCHSPTEQRWFMLRVAALADGPLRGAVVIHSDMTTRIRTAEALAALSLQTQRRERMLNTALSSITDFTYIIDPQGRLLFANQQMLDLWGVTLEEAVGKDSWDLGYPPELAARVQAQIKSVFATGETVTDVTPHDGPSGVSRFHEYVLSPAIALDGTVDFVVGCTRDITDRKRSELALQESFAEFRTLAAAMPQIVWVTDPGRAATYQNQRWRDYTGMSSEDSLGAGWVAALHPADREGAGKAWEEISETGGSYSYEARLRRADGSYRWWLVRAVSLLDEQGHVLKWIGTCTDIDDLKLAEIAVSHANRELQRQRTELRLLFDLVPAMIWFKDTRGTILRVNERGASSLGLTVAEVEGRSLGELYPAATAAAFYASDLEIIRSGEPRLGRVELHTDAAGEEIWIQKDKVPFRDETGDVAGIVVISHDVTARKRDQDALRELNADLEDRVRRRTAELNLSREDAETANRAKSEFLATMSHEIRTPMSGMLGLLELLGLGVLDTEHRSTLALARESGDSLLRIIDDILDFSKIEANGLELNLVAASVQGAVASACRLHSRIASSKNLLLESTVSPQISPFLSFDPLRLGQILNNFLNNAIKFTAQGQVELAVEFAGRHEGMEELRFVVRDTGIGMSREQVDRLFRPFAQASADTSSQFGGTGLGLVISKRLAELMGGTVTIESTLGRGTSLTLSVAFEVCEAVVETREPGSGDQQALHALMAGRRSAPSPRDAEADGTLLLIVDDHPTNRLVMTRQVASLGYASQAANDGVEAFEAWKNGKFGALITDCNMPRMNGYDLTTAIRAIEMREGRPRIAIIACTANALPAATDFCISVGMDACLVKPANLAEVAALLDQWVPIGCAAQHDPAPPTTAAPGSAVSSALSGLIDLVLLSEIAGRDPAVQAEILMEFHRVNALDATALRGAVAQGDFPRIMEFSHRMKGSSLMLGAALLGAACGRIEAAGAAKDASDMAAMMASFEKELLRLNLHLSTVSPPRPALG
ncbi:MAG: sensor hybrid histidine kinase [Ramlibacter sp.]|nr:sensor hybrid histidine kinase [Ramlibacter sp.]